MTEKKTTKENEETSASPEAPAKETPSKEKKSTKTTSSENKKKSTGSKKPALSQKEIDKLIVQNADLLAMNKEYQDNFLLLAAEFENFKKRTNKDQQRTRELFKESMLSELLPVLDDVERALLHHADDELGEGFIMIRNKLLNYLEKYDVKPFISTGEEFDPDKHDAMLTRSIEEEKDNIVLEEFEKGYMIGNKVLRHAKVIVNIKE